MRIPRRVGEGELFGDDSPSLIGSIVRRVGFSVLPSPAVAVLLASAAATIVDGDDLKLPTEPGDEQELRDLPDVFPDSDGVSSAQDTGSVASYVDNGFVAGTVAEEVTSTSAATAEGELEELQPGISDLAQCGELLQHPEWLTVHLVKEEDPLTFRCGKSIDGYRACHRQRRHLWHACGTCAKSALSRAQSV